MAETTRSYAETARTIFYVIAILMAIYGLGLLLFPQVIFTLSHDPGVPANPGWVRWAGGFVLGTAVAASLAADNPEPTASHDGIGHSLHLSHPGFALQQSRWRLPWSAVVELVADIGQRCPGGLDVVANVQICRVNHLWLSRAKLQAPSAQGR
jgi:hypothetical protein